MRGVFRTPYISESVCNSVTEVLVCNDRAPNFEFNVKKLNQEI